MKLTTILDFLFGLFLLVLGLTLIEAETANWGTEFACDVAGMIAFTYFGYRMAEKEWGQRMERVYKLIEEHSKQHAD